MIRHIMLRSEFLCFLIAVSALFFCASCSQKETTAPEHPVFLRGMQANWNERMKQEGSHALAASPENSWFTLDDILKMKNAGGNCLEIHQLGLPDLMPERNAPNEEFFTDWIDVWVNWCTQNQMYCILTVTGFSAHADWAIYLSLDSWLWDDLYPDPVSKPEYDAIIRDFFDLNVASQDINRAAFVNLWKYIASRYRDNPNVLFSIMNEPFCQVEIPDENIAKNLGMSYSMFMEEIVDAIRSTGANQIILLDMPFLWDSYWQPTVQPVNRDNIVWETHAYVAPWGSPTLDEWKNKIDLDVQKIVVEFQKPLFVGEYGIAPVSEIHTTYASSWKSIIEEQIAYLDSLNLFGRQYHCWDDMNGEYANWEGSSDLTPDESEWIIQTVLQEN